MSYPLNTLLRYFPAESTEHYTAVVLNGMILQVKPHKQAFDTLDAWLTTLPGQPTKTDLRVEEKIHASPDASWNVPTHFITYPYNHSLHSISWPAYLYKVIMKYNANLKSNAELRDAFNHLVSVLDQHKDKAYTSINYRAVINVYPAILLYPTEKEPWTVLPVQFYRSNAGMCYTCIHSYEEKKTFVPQIYDAYKPLHDLMEKYGLLSYVRAHHVAMDNKEKQRRDEMVKRRLEQLKKMENNRIKRRISQLKRRLATIERKKINIEYQEAQLKMAISNMEEQINNQ